MSGPTKFGGIVPMSYQAMTGSPAPKLSVKNDPLGPVNKIITLTQGERLIRSMLYPVRAGAAVKLGYDIGTPLIRYWSAGWEELNGYPAPEREPYREPCWYVEVDSKRVLEVPTRECQPPTPPTPRVPWRRRARTAINARKRALTDAIAKRFGYHHEDACDRSDW